jgi:hypothetical protein
MEFDFSRQMFEKCSNIKFRENSSSGSRILPSGRTDRKIDMMKLMAAFHSFVIAPKNGTGQTIGQSRRLWM